MLYNDILNIENTELGYIVKNYLNFTDYEKHSTIHIEFNCNTFCYVYSKL